MLPVPFAGALTLPDGPSPIVVVSSFNAFGSVIVGFDSSIGLAGAIPATGFSFVRAGSGVGVTAINVGPSQMVMFPASPGPVDQVIYDGTNPVLSPAPGGLVVPFDVSVPFP